MATFLLSKKWLPKQGQVILSICLSIYYMYQVTHWQNPSNLGAFVHYLFLFIGFLFQLCTAADLWHTVGEYQQNPNADTKNELREQYETHFTYHKCFFFARLLLSWNVHPCINVPCLLVSYWGWGVPLFSNLFRVLDVPELLVEPGV